MKLLENIKAVIIDDVLDEALPLMRVLAKKGSSITYFSGRQEDLPESPLTGIRLVFLDVVLDMGGQNEATRASTAAGVLGKVISKDNGPFILVVWTMHPETAKRLEMNLKTEGSGLAQPIHFMGKAST